MNKRVMYHLSCAILLLLIAQPLWAHGGGILQIASQPAGPYKVSVWTSPTRLEAGSLVHVTVGVAGQDDSPVLDATVLVEIASLKTDESWVRPATTEQATNKLFYEADMRLPEIGRYNMNIQVEGTPGRGTITFAIEILPEGQTNWFLVGFIAFGLIISMLMFRLWEKQPLSTPIRKR